MFIKFTEGFGSLLSLGGKGIPQTMIGKEVAEYLKICETSLSKYAAQGRIPAIRVGKISCHIDSHR
jgi:hypothetical protein